MFRILVTACLGIAPEAANHDVVIYGGTSAAISAAIQTVRMGKSVIVVSPDKFPQANVKGALALQKFLVTSRTQAKIRSFRVPGIPAQLWWPAARDNSSKIFAAGP